MKKEDIYQVDVISSPVMMLGGKGYAYVINKAKDKKDYQANIHFQSLEEDQSIVPLAP